MSSTMKMRAVLLAAVLGIGGGLTACSSNSDAGGGKDTPNPVKTTTTTTTTTAAGGGTTTTTAAAGDPTAKANEIFAQRCTPCHGSEGRGDGPASASLDPKPRNFHDAEWHKSVTDDHLMQIIQFGGAAVGKSAAMPANPDLKESPEVIKALVAHLRELGRQP